MSLRCRPGDLAVIVNASGRPEYLGRLVTVLFAAPARVFRLPDGHLHAGASGPGMWICEMVGDPVLAPVADRAHRATRYVSINDFRLRPIRPGEEPEATTTDEVQPVGVVA